MDKFGFSRNEPAGLGLRSLPALSLDLSVNRIENNCKNSIKLSIR